MIVAADSERLSNLRLDRADGGDRSGRIECLDVGAYGWRQRESRSLNTDGPGTSISGQEAARYLLLSFYGDPLAPREYTWTPWDVDAGVGAVVLFALDGHPDRWNHTNLVDVAEDGRILGFKPAFAPLTK